MYLTLCILSMTYATLSSIRKAAKKYFKKIQVNLVKFLTVTIQPNSIQTKVLN